MMTALKQTNGLKLVEPIPVAAPPAQPAPTRASTDWQTPRRCQFVAENQPMEIKVLRTASELTEHLTAWENLATHAIEPNIFYEHWMFLPALEQFGAHEDFRFVLIYTTGPSNEGSKPVLCGFFPLVLQTKFKGLPARHVKLWKHKYAVLCTPLVRAEFARDCLQAFLDWLGETPESGAFLTMEYVTGDGYFNQLLTDLLNDTNNLTAIEERFNRALLVRHADHGTPNAKDGEQYINLALSGKRRKELRRQEKLLREQGTLEYAELDPQQSAEVNVWLEQFLQMEAAGWKGQAGSALAVQEQTRRYFFQTMRDAAERGRLQMFALKLNGQPIALKCNVLAGAGAFALKIAFDETYANYSPGTHLELANIQHFYAQPTLQWMDSCATTRHFMINRLWLQRRSLKTLVIATGKNHGNFIVAALPLLRWVKRKFFHKAEAQNHA